MNEALNNNSCKEMLAVYNSRIYAYPQENPEFGGSHKYSQPLPCSSKETKIQDHTNSLLQEKVIQGRPHSLLWK